MSESEPRRPLSNFAFPFNGLPVSRDGGEELKAKLQRQRRRVSDAIRAAAGPRSSIVSAKENVDPVHERKKLDDRKNEKTNRALTPRRVIASIPVSNTSCAAAGPRACANDGQGQAAAHRSSAPQHRISSATMLAGYSTPICEDTPARNRQAYTSRQEHATTGQLLWRSRAWINSDALSSPHGIRVPMSWLVIGVLVLLLTCSGFFCPQRCPEVSTLDGGLEFSAWGMFKSWIDNHMEAAYMVWKLNTTHRSAAQNLYIWSQENWQLFPSLFCCILGGMPLTRAIMSLWSKTERSDMNQQRGHGAQYFRNDGDYAPFPLPMRSMQAIHPIEAMQTMQHGPDLRMMPAQHAAMNPYVLQMPGSYMNGSRQGPVPSGWFMPVRDRVARR